MIELFPQLCRHIDAGNFNIACAMGLHRTDIALTLYWMFHAADQGLAPPEIRYYRASLGLSTEKIMRVANKFYLHLTDSGGQPPMSEFIFKQRK